MQGLAIDDVPTVPLGQHAEARRQQQAHQIGRLGRRDDGDVQNRAQRVHAGIAPAVDADGIVAVILGAEAGLEHGDIGEGEIVIAVI